MDMLKELQLRRWARENYVAVSRRSIKWHPLVLDEMRLRDQELAALEPVHEPDFCDDQELAAAMIDTTMVDDPGARLVPLLPEIQRLDPPQLGPAAPHFLSKPARESVAQAEDWGFYYG